MHFRDDQLYVRGKTKRRLRWIKNATQTLEPEDEIADRYINERIEQEFPTILEAEAAFSKAETQFIESLKSNG